MTRDEGYRECHVWHDVGENVAIAGADLRSVTADNQPSDGLIAGREGEISVARDGFSVASGSDPAGWTQDVYRHMVQAKCSGEGVRERSEHSFIDVGPSCDLVADKLPDNR